MKKISLLLLPVLGAFVLFSSCKEDPAATEVKFVSLTANGESGVSSTSSLTLTFDKDVEGLSASDISIKDDAVTKGVLSSKGGGIYELAIGGLSADASLTVSVSRKDYVFTPSAHNVDVFYYSGSETSKISFVSVTADGVSGSVSSTFIKLTFDREVDGLTASDVTIVENTVTKGGLIVKGGGVYELALETVKTEGSVTVGVAKDGFEFTPPSRTVDVFVGEDDASVEFVSLTADGAENVETTSVLTFTFSKNIEGLTADDIEVPAENITKGALTAKGSGVYELAVTDVIKSGFVKVAVSKEGYVIEPANKTVNVFLDKRISVNYISLKADGESGVKTTSVIRIALDKPMVLRLDDIKVEGVSVKPYYVVSLQEGVQELSISDVVQEGDITITLSKEGYIFTPASHTVTVYCKVSAEARSLTFTNIPEDQFRKTYYVSICKGSNLSDPDVVAEGTLYATSSESVVDLEYNRYGTSNEYWYRDTDDYYILLNDKNYSVYGSHRAAVSFKDGNQTVSFLDILP